MKRKLPILYAVICLIAMLAGWGLVFWRAWEAGNASLIAALLGLTLSLFLAPFLHELGHILFAKRANMQVVYSKFFCFELSRSRAKTRFRIVSPFGAEQTQAVPKSGGNMQNRTKKYVLGGLIFSGVFLVCLVATAVLLSIFVRPFFVAFGFLPYTAYLFVLNVLPLEYGSGKTDALVYRGLKKGYDAEKTMLAAMEIQGNLYEGKRFAEIDEKLFFELPQLPEDEPLYAVILDLRYRYFLDKGEEQQAADCLNRLAKSQEYLSFSERERLAAELVYMHALRGDLERAEACGKYCKEYLQSENVSAKRILAAFSAAFGKTEAVTDLIEQALTLLRFEEIKGVEKWEQTLLSRIPQA